MRTERSIKNILTNTLNSVMINVFRFVVRTVFIKVLSETYLGVNGLFSNILGILSLAELGIGTAIGFALYTPLAYNDNEKIKSLMNYYKKAYTTIFFVVFGLGLIILPFLPFFIKDQINSYDLNLNLIYLIFLFNMSIGYLFNYKRTLIIADQKAYKINIYTAIVNIAMGIFQIIMLLVFKNFAIYLITQSVFIIIENLVVNSIVDKNYPYMKKLSKANKLDKKEEKKISKDVGALLFHKLGGYTVTFTDNIIISKFIGLVSVGLYSNYSMIINIINNIVQMFIGNITSSLGNYVAKENSEKTLKIFNEVNFIHTSLYIICAICFINLFNPFIAVWVGDKYLLSLGIVYLIVLNFYLQGSLSALDSIKNAAGMYTKDKYVPLIQSIINLGVSIICVIKYGLIGVFIGTTTSIIFSFIVKPIIVYKNVFFVSSKQYFKRYFKFALILLLSSFITMTISKNITINNEYINLLFLTVISIIIPTTLIILFNFKDEEFKSAINRLKFIRKIKIK